MASKSNKKHLQHYYKRGQSFPIYYDVWDSKAFRNLTPKARCLLFELQKAEFPNRNGFVGMSEKRAAKLLGCVENTASKAFEELQEQGFIELCLDGDYTQGKASEWRITYIQHQGREPTNEWKMEDPKKRDLRLRK